MRDESEIRLKRAYWQGVFDALNPADRPRSDKSDKWEKDRLSAGVWLTALDWILSQGDEAGGTLGKNDSDKEWDT